jgi:hypothetical protein
LRERAEGERATDREGESERKRARDIDIETNIDIEIHKISSSVFFKQDWSLRYKVQREIERKRGRGKER